MTSETKETVTVTREAAIRFLRHEDTLDDRKALKDALVATDDPTGFTRVAAEFDRRWDERTAALDQETKEPQQTTEMFFGLATTSGPRKYKDPASVAISDDSGRMRFLPLSDNDLRRLIVDGQSYLEEKERR